MKKPESDPERPHSLFSDEERDVTFLQDIFLYWGCSSAGRAPALHAGGREFDPPRLHQDVSSFAKDYQDKIVFRLLVEGLEYYFVWIIQKFIKKMVKIEETQAQRKALRKRHMTLGN